MQSLLLFKSVHTNQQQLDYIFAFSDIYTYMYILTSIFYKLTQSGIHILLNTAFTLANASLV